MAYVAIIILFILVVLAGITLFVMANTKASSPATAEDDERSDATPFSGPDHTPLGDTAQHAGEQSSEGETITPNDAYGRGGTGAPTSGPRSAGHAPSQAPDEPSGGRFKRDPIGGEAEGETTIEAGPAPRPERG